MCEFQAIVMAAGRGSRMYPLTENIPKSILPVGNLPLIWYPLNLLQTSGFEEVIVVVLESERDLISNSIEKCFDAKMKIEIVPIPDNSAMGTADSLRHIKEKIERDILVVSCDIIAEVKLHQLADIHRTYDATITVLLSSNESNEEEKEENTKKKTKKNLLTQRDIIGLDGQQNRLLIFDAEDDLDEILTLHKSLLKRFPYVNIKSDLLDGHLYIIKKWVVDFLISNKSINSIKGELIPYLIKKQYRKNKKCVEPQDLASSKEVMEEDTKNDIFNYIERNELDEWTQSLSTSDRICTEKMRCHCYIMDDGHCLRINTVPTYMESNRLIPKLLPTLSAKKELVHPLANVKKSQVGSDSMVGEGCNISESQVSIKKSIIGKHVTIGDKVKITNSVIMNHVTIKDSCNITGSVICNNVLINENSTLKDCQVGESQTLPEGSDVKGEAFGKGHMNI
ncbi:translation initiation factor eIF-2B subunit gamma-like [Dendronephthya gigantea]|uniref:translation initiation factor eIF-2B subunit gamma-like n=1 Tax=Dendronephthya gigantea TaxID=151771 RepID=UPI001069643B|nr:translation initiation factor eIF-2B subunit gamma-like [Dendronephthya gigantea]